MATTGVVPMAPVYCQPFAPGVPFAGSVVPPPLNAGTGSPEAPGTEADAPVFIGNVQASPSDSSPSSPEGPGPGSGPGNPTGPSRRPLDVFSGLHDVLPLQPRAARWMPWEADIEKSHRRLSPSDLSRANDLAYPRPDSLQWGHRDEMHTLAKKCLAAGEVYEALCIFKTLRDPAGLRRALEHIWATRSSRHDLISGLLKLEEREAATAADGLQWSPKSFGPRMWSLLFGTGTEFDKPMYEYVRAYATTRGFAEAVMIESERGVPDIIKLSADYDVFVPIASAGISLGAYANFLHLPTFVADVHAHERVQPIARWVEPPPPEAMEGKRVLLLENDTITGATIEEAVRMLAPYDVSGIGVYLAYQSSPSEEEVISRLLAQGIRVHPHRSLSQPTLETRTLFDFHERLGSPLGKMRQVLRGFSEKVFPLAEEEDPALALELRREVFHQTELFAALNPMLPGTEDARREILSALESELKNLIEFASFANENLPYLHAVRNAIASTKGSTQRLLTVAHALARARYAPQGTELAQMRGIELGHFPHSFIASLRTAKEAVATGAYDVVLIVGPEGFAYEPMFIDLGIPTVAVNIPEADYGGKRTMRKFGDLASLAGKRVLVVEDDVQSGATLQKLLRAMRGRRPADLGLYLGSPSVRQRPENIPAAFSRVFVSDSKREEDDARAFLDHLATREAIFKDEPPTWFLALWKP